MCVCIYGGGGCLIIINNIEPIKMQKKKNTVVNCHCTETPHRLPTSCTVEDAKKK